MTNRVSILGFACSLRKASYNRGLLSAALELTPPNAEVEIFDLNGIPPFNQEMEQAPPDKVKEFKTKIRAADAILIATPEYNYSMPGVLKNALDWASRPPGDNALDGKPAAIMGASTGMMGTGRAQYHLRQTLVILNVYPTNRPEVLVPFAADKFDASGRLTDQKTRDKIRELLEALVAWTGRLSGT